ncbi:24915_t:CDS:2 [Dentiscutata erythropus]|uniref:24915_t:CDS:1 n=1 Tax=Dentiscutata erythropus TaxID=1348616 RepID=A0A9N8VGC9_9GLOM|nr:24915_t:CDS:2 [Dentiscutata erythropus]
MQPNHCGPHTDNSLSATKDEVEQKVEEFIKQVDLEKLCALTNRFVPARITETRSLSKPYNSYMQFRLVALQYARQELIPGYNNQTILIKALPRIWKMMTKKQKNYFKKLANETNAALFSDYKYSPRPKKSTLKIKTDTDKIAHSNPFLDYKISRHLKKSALEIKTNTDKGVGISQQNQIFTSDLFNLNSNSNERTFEFTATNDNFSNLNPNLNKEDTFNYLPSIAEYSEAEQLFSKLEEQKDVIDRILYLKNVYAVGPDFQNDCTTLCIACWVAKPLEESVMEQLSRVLDNKFDVVYYLVDVNDSHNSYGGGLNEIEISSDAKVETVDKKSQCFNIIANLWANIKRDSKHKDMKTLEFMVYLENCSVEDLLSNQKPNYESATGSFSSMLIDEPLELNYESLKINNESSESEDEFPMIMLKESHLPLVPQSLKMAFGYDVTGSQSSTKSVKKWDIDVTYGSTNGVQWQYRFTGGDVYNIAEHRKAFGWMNPTVVIGESRIK